MSFAAPTFLWYFMPTVLTAYWILPRTFRNALISVVSLVFYAWGAGSFVLVLIVCIIVNFTIGIALDSATLSSKAGARRWMLVAGVIFDLGVLATWKYAGFASRQIADVSNALGLGHTPVISFALPIGISFFTFHHLSYIIDVYWNSRPAQKSPVQFVTYIAMFPQLIAGPIVRYHEIDDQLPDVQRHRMADFGAGFPRFALGLSKKVIVADSVSPIADAAFATSTVDLTTATAWIGIFAYTVQIYFDFSGYSDMAIGLGAMFGFRLPENFDRPYSAHSITDFWRRWHMSLSRWFKDYLYIPLGGNRNGEANTYRNLMIVFVLCGFWHGAAWTFLIWGLYHGGLLIIERITGYRTTREIGPRLVGQRALTALLVMIGWVFFRSPDLGYAMSYLKTMFVPTFGPVPDALVAVQTDQRMIVLLGALLVFIMPAKLVMGRLIERFDYQPAAAFRYAILFIATPYAAISVAAGTFSPFLYFQF
ncbi:MAG TPA: MBOAT family protein [Mycobacterium sp.]